MTAGPGHTVTAPVPHLPDTTIGRLRLGLADTPARMAQVAALRAERFRADRAGDMDRFDPLCAHLLVMHADASAAALACARLRVLDAPALPDSYCGGLYDLAPLAARTTPAVELGRLCVAAAAAADPDVPRALLAGIARIAADSGAVALIGCASFPGAVPDRHAGALGWLRARHLGPPALRPGRRAPGAFALPAPCDTGRAGAEPGAVPMLLRLYLGMGGWVSNHAVRDDALDTVHVFTAVEVARIPPARRRVLQALAAR